jgi:hypothetical protein
MGTLALEIAQHKSEESPGLGEITQVMTEILRRVVPQNDMVSRCSSE